MAKNNATNANQLKDCIAGNGYSLTRIYIAQNRDTRRSQFNHLTFTVNVTQLKTETLGAYLKRRDGIASCLSKYNNVTVV